MSIKFLCSLSLFFFAMTQAMEPAPPLSSEAQNLLIEALESFGVDPSRVRLLNCPGLKGGCANSREGYIKIDEDWLVNNCPGSLIWIGTHEAAHVGDNVSQKIIRARNTAQAVAAAGVTFGAGILWASGKGKKWHMFPFGLTAGVLPLSAGDRAVRRATEAGELRAQIMTAQKLLQQNNIKAINNFLAITAGVVHSGKVRSSKSHPPAIVEYKAVKQVLRDAGYIVTRVPDNPPTTGQVYIIKRQQLVSGATWKPIATDKKF
jgi:hypothetical protein